MHAALSPSGRSTEHSACCHVGRSRGGQEDKEYKKGKGAVSSDKQQISLGWSARSSPGVKGLSSAGSIRRGGSFPNCKPTAFAFVSPGTQRSPQPHGPGSYRGRQALRRFPSAGAGAGACAPNPHSHGLLTWAALSWDLRRDPAAWCRSLPQPLTDPSAKFTASLGESSIK